MYVELDHKLVPGKIEDIKVEKDLISDDEKKKLESIVGKHNLRQRLKGVKKYELKLGQIQDLIKVIKAEQKENFEESEEEKEMSNECMQYILGKEMEDSGNTESTKDKVEVDMEPIAWSKSENLYYDKDWGFLAAILACYNNHWVLRTTPDDWWTIIARNIAQSIDDNAEKNPVKDFFTDNEEEETIEVKLPGRAHLVEYNWLFDQFSQGIRKNIKKTEYVDKMVADFSTTKSEQKISSQIMLMCSLQSYFKYEMLTACGIPGVEMEGTLEDWLKLIDKTKSLQKMFQPIMAEIGLEKWFKTTLEILENLRNTYKGEPDKDWWGHILSYNAIHGSGGREWWEGWIVDFLGNGKVERPRDFQSGIASVPLKISDQYFGPPVEDTGELIAGTIGFTVQEGERAPVVQANQGWVLLLPKGSPVIARMKGLDLYQ